MVILAASASLLAIASSALAQMAAPAQAQQAPDRFFIAAIDVVGATELSSEEIERIVYPHLGPDRTGADVTAVQSELQAAYQAKGYNAVEVQIPVQPNDRFAQGIVQLSVNEAPLGQVRVIDAKHHSAAMVRAQVPSLVEGQPVNVAELQKDIADANRFPDRSVTPRFKAGSAPGTVDVDLKVEDASPLHASLELNNDSSPNTRSLRAGGTVRYTNLWGKGHTLSVTGSLAPEEVDQSSVLSASYNAPLFGTPWSFLVYGYTSNSNVAALGGTNVLGNGYQIGARMTYRVPSDNSYQQISFGPDFKSFREKLTTNGTDLQPTDIRYLPLVAEYTIDAGDDKQSFGLTVGVTGGLRIMKRLACFESPYAVIPEGVPTCKLSNGTKGIPADQFSGRAVDASENFVHLNFDLNYQRNLKKDWRAAFRFSGQLADSSLVTNEQFSLGGMTSVRGYYLSEAVGDDGFVGSAELISPNWGPNLSDHIDELRLYAFRDYGYARVRAATVGQTDSFKLSSYGGGVRFDMFRYVTGEFVVGVPVFSGSHTENGIPRYTFTVKGAF